jgi:hypothetical protein
MARVGLKQRNANRLGLKTALHDFTRFGLKSSDMALAAAPVAALTGFEPAAATLEAGGLAGKAVFGLASKIF